MLIELDKNLHSILDMVRETRKPEEDVVESVAGAWGYDVDGVEFARKLRRTERV
ncbi:MAG: hypothetical protein JW945_06455 [Methanomicrobia archaeon]|nr:hypothetical protein [Methanomicrobia archaeon]